MISIPPLPKSSPGLEPTRLFDDETTPMVGVLSFAHVSAPAPPLKPVVRTNTKLTPGAERMESNEPTASPAFAPTRLFEAETTPLIPLRELNQVIAPRPSFQSGESRPYIVSA